MTSQPKQNMSKISVSATSQERLIKAENAGLRLAVFCRTAAALVGFVWYLSAITFTNQELRVWNLIAFATFAIIGLAHLSLIGTRFDRWWMKYLLYAVDALSICAFFVLVPVSRADTVPQIIAFRAYGIYYLFPIVALATLSLSWRLVLWTGIMVVIGWWSAFLWVVSGMEQTLSWQDIPASATLSDYQDIFLSIDFIGRGNRIEETGLLFIASVALSVAVYRARRLFFAQVHAEEEQRREQLKRQRINDAFGKYVPESMVTQLVERNGKLPVRNAFGAAMVLDIEDFSGFLANEKTETAVRKIDEFLSDAAELVSEYNGTVISFTGDGLLASFNAPIEIEEPEINATKTAIALIDAAEAHGFKIRIGLSSGKLVSGTVGSRNRMAFTIYGDAVNRAARCEALCKELSQSVLMDEKFGAAIRDKIKVTNIGKHTLRGISDAVELYALEQRNEW